MSNGYFQCEEIEDNVNGLTKEQMKQEMDAFMLDLKDNFVDPYFMETTPTQPPNIKQAITMDHVNINIYMYIYIFSTLGHLRTISYMKMVY